MQNADEETGQIKVNFDGDLPNKVMYFNLIYHPKRC